QNPARSSRCDRLAVGHAAVRTAPSPNSDRVAAPTAARKTAPRLASSARTNRPRNSLSSPPENVGNAHCSGLSSPSVVGLLFRNGFRLSGKANLHPLAFYTINVTSPWPVTIWSSIPPRCRIRQQLSFFENFSIPHNSDDVAIRHPSFTPGCFDFSKFRSRGNCGFRLIRASHRREGHSRAQDLANFASS